MILLHSWVNIVIVLFKAAFFGNKVCHSADHQAGTYMDLIVRL